MGNIVEQIAHLKRAGKEIIIVTSGAIGIGKFILMKQHMLTGTLETHGTIT
jgi:delta-1-pyrroline-5-carboxylate synthetase